MDGGGRWGGKAADLTGEGDGVDGDGDGGVDDGGTAAAAGRLHNDNQRTR